MADEEPRRYVRRRHSCRHARCDGKKTKPGRRDFADKRDAMRHEFTAHPECKGLQDGCELPEHLHAREDASSANRADSLPTVNIQPPMSAIFTNYREEQQWQGGQQQQQQPQQQQQQQRLQQVRREQQHMMLQQRKENFDIRARTIQAEGVFQQHHEHHVLDNLQRCQDTFSQMSMQLPQKGFEDTNWNATRSSGSNAPVLHQNVYVEATGAVQSHKIEPPRDTLCELINSAATAFLAQLRQFVACTRIRRDLLLFLCTSNITEVVNVDDDLAWGERLYLMGSGNSVSVTENDAAVVLSQLLAAPLDRVQFLSLLRSHLRGLTRWMPASVPETNASALDIRAAIDSAFVNRATQIELASPALAPSNASFDVVADFLKADRAITTSASCSTLESNLFSDPASGTGSTTIHGSSYSSRETWEECAATLGPQMTAEFLSFCQSLIASPDSQTKALMLERLAIAAHQPGFISPVTAPSPGTTPEFDIQRSVPDVRYSRSDSDIRIEPGRFNAQREMWAEEDLLDVRRAQSVGRFGSPEPPRRIDSAIDFHVTELGDHLASWLDRCE